MERRIRNLSDRTVFFLVIAIAFGYYVATSAMALVLGIRELDLTTGRALRGIATQTAILLVIAWILRVRGWRLSRITGRITVLALLAGIPLFMAYYFFYAGVATAVAAFDPGALTPNVRMVVSAPMLVLLVFIVVNSVFEETLVTGYVVTALSEQGAALAITASTLLRFAYHLYQGPVASLSVLPLGVVFAAVYWKYRNVWPLAAAHTVANLIALLTTMRA